MWTTVNPSMLQILTPGRVLISAEFPANSVHTLASNDHIHVEADEEVTIQ